MRTKIKLWLVRKWIHLMPIKELRDEIFRQAMNDWYKGASQLMIDTYFRQEYLCDWGPPENPIGESRVRLKKEDE